MHILLRGFIFRIIFTGIGFLISLLIAKLAGADQFGSLSLMIVNAAFIYIITGLGTDAAIVWHGLAGKNYGRDKIFSFTIITAGIQLLFFYIIAILGFLFLGHTLLGGNFGLKIFLAEIVYFTGLVIAEKFTSLYYSQHEAKRCNRILALVSFILFIGVIVIWVIHSGHIVENAIWIYSLFTFIPSIILMVSFFIAYRPSLKSISEEDYRSFSSFSVIVMITNTIQFIAFRADYWIISIYYDHDVVGVYAQASKFAQTLWIIPGILAGLITPALKNEQQKLTEADLFSVTRFTFYSHLLLAILLIAAALIIYSAFLPLEYFDGFYSLLIMLPGYLLFIITTLFAAYFSANRLLKINLYGSILCCVLMVLLDFILVPGMSYKGAAIANLLAYSITTIYFIYQGLLFMKLPVSSLFTIRRGDFNLFSGSLLKSSREN
ncbi:MAG TPA: oligosaccharide flippase family protein [Chitinophagaceae bacterium]|nr:oligosaccharide flippase family protein [Chitinophagaceae bacterium]